MCGLHVWKGLRVLQFVYADVATLSLLQPSNWMGGETVGLFTHEHRTRDSILPPLAPLAFVRRACFVSSGPEHFEGAPVSPRRSNHKGMLVAGAPRGEKYWRLKYYLKAALPCLNQSWNEEQEIMEVINTSGVLF